MNARLDFDQIERLADEILGPLLQGAQLVTRLCGQHNDRQVIIRIDRFKGFHYLESIHARHLQIEQDQVVMVLAMQRTDLHRISCRGNASVAGLAQQLLEQLHIGRLIIDDQDVGIENIGGTDHHAFFPLFARAASVFANVSARSSVSMNSLTLMGLVR